MKFNIIKKDIATVKADIALIGIYEENQDNNHKVKFLTEDGGASLDKALKGELSKLILQEEFKGSVGDEKLVFTSGRISAKHVLIVGFGKKEDFSAETLRSIGGNASKLVNEIKAKSLALVFQDSPIRKISTAIRLQSFVEGLILGSYKFDKYKDKEKQEGHTLTDLNIITYKQQSICNAAIKKAVLIANATNLARDMGNTPSIDMTPTEIAKIAKNIASKKGLSCNVMGLSKIKSEKMNAFLSIAKGSSEPLVFIHMQYKPKTKAKTKVALVGKGITFDSGGISLKPPKGMEDMKDDMCGAAAVIGIMQAVAELKPPVAVDAFIPACENMPSGSAIKPGDIVKARNKKTIEIISTDAEGRVILADALSYAAATKPDYIIDIATLTGHCAYAIGERYIGILGNNQELIDKIIGRGKDSGEKMWQLPLEQEYKKGITKGIADLRNTGSTKAGTIDGALFLEEFVDKIKWAHLDIASVSICSESHSYTPKGCTGAGVRSLLYFLMNF